jgi:hypothetical protein
MLNLNNPGNIRISPVAWVGKVTPSRDPQFETFDTPEHGLRAIAVQLLSDFNFHKLNTVTEIIARWAPDNENDTTAYIANVCDWAGFGPDQMLTPDEPTLIAFSKAITRQENGFCPYPDTLIAAAVADALSTMKL